MSSSNPLARQTRTAFLVLLASIVLCSSASAQNLLANGEFDTDLAPWTLFNQEFIEMSWTSGDVDGSLTSGSLETYSQSGGPYQCVPVSGNSEYFLDGYVAPLSLDRAGTVNHTLAVEWFSSSNCSFGTALSFESLPAATTLDTFERLSGSIVAPLSANSARVWLYATNSGGFARALYDSVYLPEPGFGMSIVLAVGALGGLARCRRR
ncbi:MAG: hypothetical protein AB8G23_19035 [Myxococcota bacterium]